MKNFSPSLLVLFSARFINNKTETLQEYVAGKDVNLACVTKTGVVTQGLSKFDPT